MRKQNLYLSAYVLNLFFIFLYLSFKTSYHQQLNSGPQDIFYYLIYSRELSMGNFFSWNGLFPSTGFHPLWTLLLSIIFFISDNLVSVVIMINLLLLILTLITVNYSYRFFNNKNLTSFFFYLFFITILLHKYYFWFMESALLCTCLLSYFFLIFNHSSSYSVKNFILISIFASLIILSRLDNFLILAPIHFLIFAKTIHLKKYFYSIILSIIPIIFVGTYLIILKSTTGYYFPLSGIVKSSFPNFFEKTNFDVIINSKNDGIIIFFAILMINILLIFEKIFHNLKIFTKNYLFLINVNLGFIIFVSYHYTFTSSPEIGSWYFSSSYLILIINVMFLFNFIEENAQTFSHRIVNFLNSIKFVNYSFVIFVIFLTIYMLTFKRLNFDYQSKQPFHYFKFYQENKLYFEDKKLKILDTGDGAFAFFSNMPTYHSKGLAGTPEYINFLKNLKMNGHLHDPLNIGNLNVYLTKSNIDFVIYYSSYNQQFIKNNCENFFEINSKYQINKNLDSIIGLIRAEKFSNFLKICVG